MEALSDGLNIGHEVRDSISEKNLLATGEVSSAFVAMLLMRCRGNQYSASRHHIQRDIEVHTFKPVIADGAIREHWYIKLYFIEQVVFISVHLSGFEHD